MITELKDVSNEDLALFLTRVASGIIFASFTDDHVLVVERKRFNPFTGVELPDREVIAAVPASVILDEVGRVQAWAAERVQMLQTFIANENL